MPEQHSTTVTGGFKPASPAAQQPVYSEFAAEPDFAELLELFAQTLDEKRQAFCDAFRAGALEELRTQAHQLKGSAGGYGFPELSVIAARLEQSCRNHDMQDAGSALEELIAYLGRIRV